MQQISWYYIILLVCMKYDPVCMYFSAAESYATSLAEHTAERSAAQRSAPQHDEDAIGIQKTHNTQHAA